MTNGFQTIKDGFVVVKATEVKAGDVVRTGMEPGILATVTRVVPPGDDVYQTGWVDVDCTYEDGWKGCDCWAVDEDIQVRRAG